MTATHQAPRRPEMADGPMIGDPLLQWANHLKTGKRDVYYDGFFVPMAEGAEPRAENVELDTFLKSINWPTIQIKHGETLKTHWALPVLDAFVIATGVQSWPEIKLDTDPNANPPHPFVRYGIAVCWNDLQRSSFLRLRCIPRAWLAAGWTKPIMLTVKSYFVQDVLRALVAHFRVLDAIEESAKATGKAPVNAPYYEVAVHMGAGEAVTRGKPGNTAEVTPVVTFVPDNVDREYLLAHYSTPEQKEILLSLVDQTVLWSTLESKRLAAMADQNQPATPQTTNRPPLPGAGNRNVPVAVGADDGEDLPF